MSKDGTSLSKLYDRCNNRNNIVLVVKDENNYVFGGYTWEPWEHQGLKGFYGSGQTMLFTFKDGINPTVYDWKGIGNQHMFADDKMIGIAGSPET